VFYFCQDLEYSCERKSNLALLLFSRNVHVLQLLHIYSVPSNEVVAFPVMEGQQSLSLKIQSSLHVDTSDQELLTPTGTVADLNTDLSQYCLNQVLVSIYTDLLFV